MIVAVVGASGFIGAAVVRALAGAGHEVRPVAGPRLSTGAATVADVRERAGREPVLDDLRAAFAGAEVVVCAAGLADAVTGRVEDLLGANALLPAVVAHAAGAAGARRTVHVSSASVQGEGLLDDTERRAPFSAYSRSKALGEEALAGEEGVVVVRPASVHGPGRAVTDRLRSICRSPLLVLPRTPHPTPQSLVGNTASAIAYAATHPGPVPAIVHVPWEGLDTHGLVTALAGRPPRTVPDRVAAAILRAASAAVAAVPSQRPQVRRLQLLWHGQEVAPGWFERAGWAPAYGLAEWERLGRA